MVTCSCNSFSRFLFIGDKIEARWAGNELRKGKRKKIDKGGNCCKSETLER